MSTSPSFKDTVLLVTRPGMGSAEPDLQLKLFITYLKLLLEGTTLPNVICFYTQSVRLVVADSPVLDLLAQLEARGVRLIVCSTCLNYYDLQDQVRVGIVGSMADIIEAQTRAAKVISL
jgi:hypothetical protein